MLLTTWEILRACALLHYVNQTYFPKKRAITFLFIWDPFFCQLFFLGSFFLSQGRFIEKGAKPKALQMAQQTYRPELTLTQCH